MRPCGDVDTAIFPEPPVRTNLSPPADTNDRKHRWPTQYAGAGHQGLSGVETRGACRRWCQPPVLAENRRAVGILRWIGDVQPALDRTADLSADAGFNAGSGRRRPHGAWPVSRAVRARE